LMGPLYGGTPFSPALKVCHLLERPATETQYEGGDKTIPPISKMSIELELRNRNNAAIRRMARRVQSCSL
jgi:hypothetical protein